MALESEQRFRIGYWLFQHRTPIRRVIWVVLGVIGGLIWLNAARFGVSYLAHRQSDAAVQASFLQPDLNFDSIEVPQDLQISQVQAVRNDDTHVDLVALVKNSNARFASSAVTGRFVVNSIPQEPITFFVNPDEEKYVPQLAVSAKSSPQPTVRFELLSVDWYRLHGTQFQTNWVVSDLVYKPLVLSGGDSLQRGVDFQLFNNTAYGFKQIRVSVFLRQGQQLVGLGSTLTDRVQSLEKKQYRFYWSSELPLSAEPVVQIDIDRGADDQLLSIGAD